MHKNIIINNRVIKFTYSDETEAYLPISQIFFIDSIDYFEEIDFITLN